MLKLADLAARPDFRVGPLLVSPSRRLVEGPGGQANLEPRVMQVFVLLLDADGKVVTRNQLFDQVWGGVMVGDDSLNRTVGAIRKLAAEIAGGSFEIETIPRTGYRLAGDIADFPGPREDERFGGRISRRRLIAGSGAAAIVAGGGLWWAERRRREASFDRLLDQIGERFNNTDFDEDTRKLTERAVTRRPDSARAWGYLAGIRSVAAQTAPAGIETATVQKAVEAAEKALALDPNEPNALLAMFQLKGSTLDWLARDRTLRHIIALDPRNVLALTELVALLQAAGLNRESWTWNERALAIVPLSSTCWADAR